MPATAIPGLIYDGLLRDVTSGDRHSHWIEKNRAGILNGAEVKHAAGVITDSERLQIRAIVELAEVRDFRPLLYVIPFQSVQDELLEVPPAERAHPMSKEYRLEALQRCNFDVVQLVELRHV